MYAKHVCFHVYFSIIYVCLCVCMYVCIYVYMYIYVYIILCISMYACKKSTHACTCVQSTCTHVCFIITCVYIYVYVYIYIYILRIYTLCIMYACVQGVHAIFVFVLESIIFPAQLGIKPIYV